ncbi:hypothetical protein D3C80_1685600 [compost metagenome]
MQHAQGGHGGTDIDQRHRQALVGGCQPAGEQAKRTLQRIRLDIDHTSREAGQRQGRFEDFDIFLATGGEQHIHTLGIAR